MRTLFKYNYYTQEIKKKFLNVKKLKYPQIAYLFFFFFLTKCRVKLKKVIYITRSHRHAKRKTEV